MRHCAQTEPENFWQNFHLEPAASVQMEALARSLHPKRCPKGQQRPIAMLFELRQSLLLLLTAVIWGCTFVAQSMGMDSVGPFTFTASRMCLGAIFLFPIACLLRKRLGRYNPAALARRRSPEYAKNLLIGGSLCGLCLFSAESFQQFGLAADVEAGKSGFITALYIVLVPILGMLLGRRSRLLIWAAVALACIGLWYLCIPEGAHITLSAGDFYTLCCALVFSIHILIISHFIQKVDGVELSMMQFAAGSAVSLAAMLFFESPTWEGWTAALLPILWAGIMSNGIAYTLQMVGQRGMNETAASLIMSLESVVSVLAGWAVLGEVLSSRELLGCVIMGFAVVLAQLPAKKKQDAGA